MYIRGAFLAIIIGFTGHAAAWSQQCDDCAHILADLGICTDVFVNGHCDPRLACPCWEKAKDASLLDLVIEAEILEAINVCVCVDVL